ncbi:MAG: hypothetical protein OHK0019_32620 [Saprospiraceae bacterium]
MNQKNLNTTLFNIYLLGFVLLIGIVIYFSKNNFVYDESAFVENLDLIEEYGISKELFTKLEYQFPGPLYQIVHKAIKPLTNYEPRAMRLANVAFLILLTIILVVILQKAGISTPRLKAARIISIPMTWVIGGLTLSEMPAMFFAALGILLFLYSINEKDSQRSYLMALIGGLMFGLSITGRTLFIVTLPAFLLWIGKQPKNVLLFVLSGLIFPIYMFVQWEGLSPQDVSTLRKEGVHVWFSFFALGYLALITLILTPSWFKINKNRISAVVTILSMAIIFNFLFSKIYFLPARSVFQNYFPYLPLEYIGLVFPCIIITFGFLFLIEAYERIFNKHERPATLFIFSFLSTLLIIVSIAKSSPQFSSRYIAQAAPFIIIYLSFIENSKASIILHLVGICIGSLSLISYLSGS